MPTDGNLIVGIDLGTSTSLIARWEHGESTVWWLGDEGRGPIDSVVYFHDGNVDDPRFGRQAARAGVVYPEQCLVNIKRSMGKNVMLEAASSSFSPAQAASFLLRYLKEKVERDNAGHPIELAVVATPYSFNHKQNLDTLEAARLAGFSEGSVHLIPEPTAAALTYGLATSPVAGPKRMFVFDLGGGTFDITICEVRRSPSRLEIRVLTTGGLGSVGGINFDDKVAAWAHDQFKEEFRVGLDDVEDEHRRLHSRWLLQDAAKQVKEELANAGSADLMVPTWVEGHNLVESLSREQFDELIADELREIDRAIDTCLHNVGLTQRDIDRVLLVGGSSRVTAVRNLLEAKFAPVRPEATANPQEAVVRGAAIYAGILAGDLGDLPEIRFENVVSYPIGVRAVRGADTDRFDPVIARDQRVPAVGTSIYDLRPSAGPELRISVYQGNSTRASRNALISTIVEPSFAVDGSTAQVKLTLRVNAENVVTYELCSMQTGETRSGLLRSVGSD